MEINDSYVNEKLTSEQRAAVQQLVDLSEVVIQRAILTGHSGASVFVASVQPTSPSGPRGLHILKIDRRDQAQKERESHKAARATMIGSYMPRLVLSSPSVNGQIATLYSLAHNSLLNSLPLRELIDLNFLVAQRQVETLSKILTDWNADSAVCNEPPGQLLRSLLGTLLRVEKAYKTSPRRLLSWVVKRNASVLLAMTAFCPTQSHSSHERNCGKVQVPSPGRVDTYTAISMLRT